MKLGFGRVVPPPAGDAALTVPVRPGSARRLGRVEPAEVVDASEQARAVVKRGEERARAVLEEAEKAAAGLRKSAADEARAEVVAGLAARELALVEREQRALADGFDDIVTVARLLAERLLGEELRLAPERITALARQALTEARGAERVTLVAHPEDVPQLERAVLSGDLAGVAEVITDATRARGQLRLETNVGALDAELAPQLDRLAAKLRESRRHG